MRSVGIFFILLSCIVQGMNAFGAGRAEGPSVCCLFTLAGGQYVFEERVMSFNNAPPMVCFPFRSAGSGCCAGRSQQLRAGQVVVGMEGVWGSLMMLFVVFPFAYYMPGETLIRSRVAFSA